MNAGIKNMQINNGTGDYKQILSWALRVICSSAT
jgi:hypothetical protein